MTNNIRPLARSIARPTDRHHLLPLLSGLLALLALTFTLVRAQGENSITTPDATGDAAWYTSLVLDASGHPVVSYYAFRDGDLRVLHCNDPNCAGGDESITAPDTAGNVGQFTSLALDGDGNPVVSYRDVSNGDLKVLHCNDPNCAGGDESITVPDPGGDTGRYTSLVLDGNGNPVITYHSTHLKVMHCNDPNCAGGDESITVPDPGGDTGAHNALALDHDGNPVVSYADFLNQALKILHCNDPNCAGGDESITAPDTAATGQFTSLALDGDGNPVVTYFEFANFALKLLHCNDPNCAGDDESITTPEPGDNVRVFTSLALDGDGNPVVSYYDNDARSLKLLHCNDPDCAGGDESITVPDTIAGRYTSLALDGEGNPVVSYDDFINDALAILHCGSPSCDPTPPVISATTSGMLGNNNWYTSDVAVSWHVADDESVVTASDGCETVLVDADTPGTTFTCSATSAGGTSAASITVRRDATAPVVRVTGVADGATYILGSVPPAGCDTADALSGVVIPASLTISGGEPDGSGAFTVMCEGAQDNAGNAGSAAAIYTVLAPPGAIAALQADIQDLVDAGVLRPGQANGLTRPLDNALRSLERGRTAAACSQLQDFIAEVLAKTPDPLDPATAAGLIADAEAIRLAVGCG